VLSHVPGGVGVFEAILLAAFADQLGAAPLAAALLLYRLIYVVLPLLWPAYCCWPTKRAPAVRPTSHPRGFRAGRTDSGGPGVPVRRGAAVLRRHPEIDSAWNTWAS
jgi:hypothetical protein